MTIPKTILHRLHEQAERLKDRPALWTKREGAYRPTSWKDYAERVKAFSLGLLSLGLKRGQALLVLGFNREEWVVADLSAMAVGGLAVGVYTTSSPEQLRYIAGHCEAPIALVETAEQLEAVLALKPQLPALKHVITMGELGGKREGVFSFKELLERGRAADDAEYYACLEALRPADVAQLIYTSGTTGHPKGVMLTHHNLCWTTAQLSLCYPTTEDDALLSYLPLSHIAEQVCSIYAPVHNGFQVYFAESFEQLAENLREVRPTVFFGVPRVWEKFKARAEASLAQVPAARARVLKWGRGVALRYHQAVISHQQPSIALQAQYAAAQQLVFGPLKARLGLDRVRVISTSAAPISREVLEFFASLDLVLTEIYGQSEVTGPTSVSTLHAMRFGKLGRPLPGAEVRIAEDGEILVRGGNVCAGYYKDPDATAELLHDGWLHSGDLGALDEEGLLSITGRKKEIIVTSGGKKTAPSNLEGLLKALPPIGNALVLGDRRNYLVALLTLDPDRVRELSAKHGWPTDSAALSKDPSFLTWLGEAIERDVNAKLSRFETIKKFEVLPEDFSIAGGELTSTLKVRRKVCEQKYEATISKLYA